MSANSAVGMSKRLPPLEAHQHSGESSTRNMFKVPQKQVEEALVMPSDLGSSHQRGDTEGWVAFLQVKIYIYILVFVSLAMGITQRVCSVYGWICIYSGTYMEDELGWKRCEVQRLVGKLWQWSRRSPIQQGAEHGGFQRPPNGKIGGPNNWVDVWMWQLVRRGAKRKGVNDAWMNLPWANQGSGSEWGRKGIGVGNK